MGRQRRKTWRKSNADSHPAPGNSPDCDWPAICRCQVRASNQHQNRRRPGPTAAYRRAQRDPRGGLDSRRTPSSCDLVCRPSRAGWNNGAGPVGRVGLRAPMDDRQPCPASTAGRRSGADRPDRSTRVPAAGRPAVIPEPDGGRKPSITRESEKEPVQQRSCRKAGSRLSFGA